MLKLPPSASPPPAAFPIPSCYHRLWHAATSPLSVQRLTCSRKRERAHRTLPQHVLVQRRWTRPLGMCNDTVPVEPLSPCLPPRPPSPRLPLLPSPALATCRSGAWVATRAQPRAHSAASKLAASHRGGAHTRHSVDHALHAPQRRLKLASSASHTGAATLRPVVERRRRQHAKVTNGDRRLPFETSLGGAALTTLAARVRRLPRLHALDHRGRPRCRRRLGRRA